MSEGFSLVVRFTLRGERRRQSSMSCVHGRWRGIKTNEPRTLAYVIPHTRGRAAGAGLLRAVCGPGRVRRAEDQPHTKRFLAEREQYLAGVEVTFLDAIAGRWQRRSESRGAARLRRPSGRSAQAARLDPE
ncbi:antibiotic biosynthesis monooxygenase [Streptomyces tricolor]|nr:antibiotic biosynthesis monooxygenase [Streptomyces tricolor]